MPNLRRRFPPWRRCGPASQRLRRRNRPLPKQPRETQARPRPGPPRPAPRRPLRSRRSRGRHPARRAGGRARRRGGRPQADQGDRPEAGKLCNRLGFYHFDQIAAWTADEVAWVDQNLEGFKGRVTRDNWVEQARLLASGGETEFSKKVDKGDVY
jgi:hypothetical protein